MEQLQTKVLEPFDPDGFWDWYILRQCQSIYDGRVHLDVEDKQLLRKLYNKTRMKVLTRAVQKEFPTLEHEEILQALYDREDEVLARP